jgi:hypothetical protein
MELDFPDPLTLYPLFVSVDLQVGAVGGVPSG